MDKPKTLYPRPTKKPLSKRFMEKMTTSQLFFWTIFILIEIIFLLILWNSKGQTYGYF